MWLCNLISPERISYAESRSISNRFFYQQNATVVEEVKRESFSVDSIGCSQQPVKIWPSFKITVIKLTKILAMQYLKICIDYLFQFCCLKQRCWKTEINTCILPLILELHYVLSARVTWIHFLYKYRVSFFYHIKKRNITST